MKLLKLLFIIILGLLTACDFFHKGDRLFGHSKTRQEALSNGSPVYLYVADKNNFKLLDGTTLTTDTAWTEVSFTYKGGERILDSSYGFHFSIPFKKSVPNTFTFTFSLLDTTNRMFTNGIDEELCQLCPFQLRDDMRVILEQKDTDTSKGWTNPILTDTITYKRLID
ncbi:MAG: hypothetical protein JWQ27_211 [Ferruginibacter sp.]|nr:hypothetical protein [Ferruginibacter sp.]